MLGMVGGTILTVGMGFIAIYTSYIIGQVKLKYPQVVHYSDIGRLLIPGRGGVILTKVMQVVFVVFLCLGIGAHFLTGKMAFSTIVGDSSICGLAWSAVTLVLLFVCSVPPSFAEMSFLGYIDFVSIMSAVFVTLVATGITARKNDWETGWTAAPMPGLTFGNGLLAACNVLFAYAFSICQFSFMEEMATPSDFPKSIFTLGVLMITIYTVVGALGYAFIGPTVKGPALLSAGSKIARVAFGIALPVIFISGAILVVTVGRFIMDHAFKNNVVRYVNTARGWTVWVSFLISVDVNDDGGQFVRCTKLTQQLGIVAAACLVSWLIAEVIPVFNPLLGITASLFNSAFTLYLPGLMWFLLIREGGCFSSGKNIVLTLVNGFIIVLGLVALGGGTWASADDIAKSYSGKSVGKPFSCK